MRKSVSCAVVVGVSLYTNLIFCAEPPKCSDKNTLSTVLEIILENIGAGKLSGDEKVTNALLFEVPHATSYDEKIKKYSCEAVIISGGKYKIPVRYDSQLDDNDQHLVFVKQMSRTELEPLVFGLSDALKKRQAVNTQVESSSQPSPVSKSAQPTATTESMSGPHTQPANQQNVDSKSQQQWKVSFDCGKAATYVEKNICSNIYLSQLDGVLSQNYKYISASDIGDDARKHLKSTQKNWLQDRNKCSDVQCLVDIYKKRIDEICDYPVLSGIHPECVYSNEISH